MIRLNPTARPEAWTTIEITIDEETAPMRVRYWLLSPNELAAIAEGEDKATPAKRTDSMQQLLRERVLDWDLEDGSVDPPAKLPVTPETLQARLNDPRFFLPLYLGLLNAASGAARKNA